MQDNLHAVQPMLFGMLSYSPRRLRNDLIGHSRRAATPALIRGLIHVAVVTSQITPAMDLQDKLAQQRVAARTLGSDIRPERRHS
jgi:hypothetical protein